MTKLLVLAMLGLKPMTGYEIKVMLEMNDAERWGGVLIGSIYNALKKLEREGYIEVASIESTGHRQKVIYQITEKGKAYEQDLIIEALEKSSVVYPTTLYSGVAFACKLQDEKAVCALEKQKKILEGEEKAIAAGYQAKLNAMQGEIPTLTQLAFDNMLEIVKVQLKFVNQAIQIIRKDENNSLN
ncbi:PadR family transcriptional regulator [Lysinibacillus sp. NPDC048646]|uniref:PadR family transcriptional regulator n=1 Tax=Lysinibacillus sp. NPDC048646 TaxID=3390574 RepID=UPI003D09244E